MKRLLLGLFTLCAMFIIGCGGAALIDAPEIDMVVMDTASVTIYWGVDTDIEGHADFQGYNVYIATDTATLMVEDGEDLNHINTGVITDSFATITGLSQDTVYYIQVRTVNTDDVVGSYNATVPYIEASPRPVFVKTVYVEWYNGQTSDCALHLSTGAVMMRSNISTTWGDIWLDHAVVLTEDSVWIQSAYRADTLAGFRDTRLANVGQQNFDDVWEAPEPTLRVVPIVQGDLVFAKTDDGNYAKIHVDSLHLSPSDSTGWAILTYAYQNIAEFPFLGPQR